MLLATPATFCSLSSEWTVFPANYINHASVYANISITNSNEKLNFLACKYTKYDKKLLGP